MSRYQDINGTNIQRRLQLIGIPPPQVLEAFCFHNIVLVLDKCVYHVKLSVLLRNLLAVLGHTQLPIWFMILSILLFDF